MLIQGVEVTPENVEWLRQNVPEPAATTLRDALADDRLRLKPGDADQVLNALLDDPPPGLDELRATLLHERERRPM